jgi:hypothetical protein
VPRWKIRRLYEQDAAGIYDDGLVLDVGYALFARCQSFIAANRATRGEAACPRCSAVIPHEGNKNEWLRCKCGWKLTWGEYFATIQHKQLSGADPVLNLFRDYVDRFPLARSSRDKMLLMDHLIHGFHWYYKMNGPTRPVAVNLIEGRLRRVISFLDSLTYGENSTPGVVERKDEWNRLIETAREWYKDP